MSRLIARWAWDRFSVICGFYICSVSIVWAQAPSNDAAGASNANTILATEPFQHHLRLDAAAASFSPDKFTSSEVAAITDAVFAIPHFGLIQQVPAWAATLVKQRLATAEEAYWKGRQAAIREEDIAAALNSVVAKLNLPEYAQTNQSQIRHLRMETLERNPRFMGLKVRTESSTGEPSTIFGTMSPLQAFHLTLTLIDQKFVAPFYQVTPAEWEIRRSRGSRPTAPAGKPRPHVETMWDNPRSIEMQDRLHEGFRSLTDAEGVEMLMQTLNAIGIR